MNMLLAPSDAWWAAVAFSAVWKPMVVLICAGMIVVALRRASASARHLVWSLALAGTLVLPLFTVALPSWSWTILPTSAVAQRPEIKTGQETSGTIPPDPSAFDGPSAQRGSDEEVDETTRIDRGSVTSSGSISATAVPVASKPGPWPVRVWALGIWLAGAALVLGGPILGRLILFGAIRGAVAVERGEWAELARAASQQLGLRRRVRILRSDRSLMPVTWGWIRPVVLVPARADLWQHERRRDVLMHELAHVRRLDCLSQSVAQIACAVYWFNPLAWLAARRMRIERERACDDIVLLAGSPASDYAAHLLEIARDFKRDRLTALAAVAMAQPGAFEGRLLAILDPKQRRNGVSFRAAAFVAAALCGGLIPLAAVRLSAHAATAVQTPRTQSTGDRRVDASPGSRMTVTGLVVDQTGEPVANAAVMVYTQPRVFERPTLFLFENPLIIGEARSDGSGRFRIDAPRTSSSTHGLLCVTALAPGLGLGWIEVDPDALEPTGKVALPPEFVIEGRLFDLQGQPARGVKVAIQAIRSSTPGEPEGPIFVDRPPESLAAWPALATTDAEGRFTVRGVGRERLIELAVDDARFASLRTAVATGEAVDPGPLGSLRPIVKLGTKPGEKKLSIALEAAKIITGRVTYADNGKPVPHAPLSVMSRSDTLRGGRLSRFKADSEGRFRINPPTGDHFGVTIQAPDGQPYLSLMKTIDWPKGAVEQTVEFALPRGGLISGKVTEHDSGKPVGGAIVRFTPYTVSRADSSAHGVPSLTNSDGSFRIAGVPDRGYVVVQGPSDDYVLKELGAAGGAFSAQPGNRRFYAHAYTFIDLKPASAARRVDLTIQRASTVKGRVVGPDDRPVQDALMLSRVIIRSMPTGGWKIWVFNPGVNPGGHVRDGRFEIHGLDRESETPVYFLDSEHELGATVSLSGKSAAAGPLSVRLERCGTAKARLVNSGGKPVKGQSILIDLIVTPGVNVRARDENPGVLVANSSDPFRFDPKHYRPFPASDAQGHIVFPDLIPGATYRFSATYASQGPRDQKEISVKPGETVDLGDILVEKPSAGM